MAPGGLDERTDFGHVEECREADRFARFQRHRFPRLFADPVHQRIRFADLLQSKRQADAGATRSRPASQLPSSRSLVGRSSWSMHWRPRRIGLRPPTPCPRSTVTLSRTGPRRLRSDTSVPPHSLCGSSARRDRGSSSVPAPSRPPLSPQPTYLGWDKYRASNKNRDSLRRERAPRILRGSRRAV